MRRKLSSGRAHVMSPTCLVPSLGWGQGAGWFLLRFPGAPLPHCPRLLVAAVSLGLWPLHPPVHLLPPSSSSTG